MSLSMLKICTSSCGILNPASHYTSQLTDTELACINLCSTNIKNTFADFRKTTHELVGNAGEDGADDDEEEEDDE